MEFRGKYLFFASQEEVWAALNDVETLQAAIPGCDHLAWFDDDPTSNQLEVSIKVPLGIFSPVFHGTIELKDVVEAKSYTLFGQGEGAVLGLAQGEAKIVLEKHDEGTVMRLIALGDASSSIMVLGQRILGNAAQGVIDRFFERFAAAMDVKLQVLQVED